MKTDQLRECPYRQPGFISYRPGEGIFAPRYLNDFLSGVPGAEGPWPERRKRSVMTRHGSLNEHVHAAHVRIGRQRQYPETAQKIRQPGFISYRPGDQFDAPFRLNGCPEPRQGTTLPVR